MGRIARVVAVGYPHHIIQRGYTKAINENHGWRGYLWQGRFLSYPMDEVYSFLGVRYVERNPVRAGMVKRAEDYPWSSARSHVNGKKDILISRCYLQDVIKDRSEYLRIEDEKVKEIRKNIGTGRPLGAESFLKVLEEKTGRTLVKQKLGPKPKEISCVSP